MESGVTLQPLEGRGILDDALKKLCGDSTINDTMVNDGQVGKYMRRVVLLRTNRCTGVVLLLGQLRGLGHALPSTKSLVKISLRCLGRR